MRYVTSQLSFRALAVTAATAVLTAVLTIVGVSLTSSAQAVVTTSGLPLTQVFFVPLDEDDVQDALAFLNPAATSTTIQTIVSIAIGFDSTVIVYDHGEDGYELDLENPVQGTTEVWGDGVIANGDACAFVGPSCVGDVLLAGDVLILQSAVPTPRNPATIDFDGGDKFAADLAVAVTRVGWADPPGTVLAGAVEVLEVSQWGLGYELPIGEDLAVPLGVPATNLSDNMFEYVAVAIMASEDTTMLTVDENDGGLPFNVMLDQG